MGDPERDLHARGGLRDPLEARRPAGAARSEVRRSRRLVVSFVVDRRQLRVRLLLVLLPRRQHPARGEAHRHRVADGDRAGHAAASSRTWSAEGVAAPHHQHLFNARLDFDVDGADQRGLRGRGRAHAARPRQPVAATRSGQRSTRLETELGAQRDIDAAALADVAHRRTRTCATGSGSRPRTSSCRRCRRRRCSRTPTRRSASAPAFAQHNLWVTPYAPTSGAPRASTRTSTRAATACPRGPRHDRSTRRHRRRRLVHVRRHALRAARGLAGHAGRVHRLHADAVRLLRPQPRARRAAERRALRHDDVETS